ncbi:hypothetical protein B398_04235 [Xylella fastidiosa 32]|uniref:hypothetical protein n=1 Tax=Xylella fastidiosa TaxID=2371 RepID=UPI0003D36F85|nr:hypothetical protein [Xylella fastidiosa]ETE33508.1 hypothetical protein B398_04235 [Xylella fastidiosa 32]QPB73306.1 hypothetical protein XFC3_12850 [Xylella fastidiosa]
MSEDIKKCYVSFTPSDITTPICNVVLRRSVKTHIHVGITESGRGSYFAGLNIVNVALPEMLFGGLTVKQMPLDKDRPLSFCLLCEAMFSTEQDIPFTITMQRGATFKGVLNVEVK